MFSKRLGFKKVNLIFLLSFDFRIERIIGSSRARDNGDARPFSCNYIILICDDGFLSINLELSGSVAGLYWGKGIKGVGYWSFV